jgi:hypothetical protein
MRTERCWCTTSQTRTASTRCKLGSRNSGISHLPRIYQVEERKPCYRRLAIFFLHGPNVIPSSKIQTIMVRDNQYSKTTEMLLTLLKLQWLILRKNEQIRPYKLIPSNRVISSPFSHKTFFFHKISRRYPICFSW